MAKQINVSQLPWPQAGMAQKTAEITAERVPEGFEVTTIMADGHTETKNVAGPGGAFLATNPGGEQYLIKPDKLERLYDLMPSGRYRPKPEMISFLATPVDVTFKAPWGEVMNIKAGGALVNRGGDDIYGIQPKEFNDTYSVITTPKRIASRDMPIQKPEFADHVLDCGADILQVFHVGDDIVLSHINFDRPKFRKLDDLVIEKGDLIPHMNINTYWGDSFSVSCAVEGDKVLIELKDVHAHMMLSDAEKLNRIEARLPMEDRVIKLVVGPEEVTGQFHMVVAHPLDMSLTPQDPFEPAGPTKDPSPEA